ncbi:MAG: AAA family ATPase [Dysgonamonadaceae bacterium]|jgi:predicted ATPase|nr:AAA family ATPase [Dysgonamonadaceae bacterium]
MTIHKLILRNFKKIKEETFLFNNFDLIVGANNSGKSTCLQALAIWQFCVDQFRVAKRTGSSGTQVVLPNFTALPLPEFNLLWTNRIDRKASTTQGKRTQEYIYIEIDVYWKNEAGEEKNFCVTMRYQTPQSVYAIPKPGWPQFRVLDKANELPRIVYVPPFSALEPHEKWLDDGNVRQNIGKAQPGSVLRNLLYRVIDREDVAIKDNENWKEIVNKIKDWFGVDLVAPKYEKTISTEILSEYKSNGKTYDIISGGSGFHQILTLLAFLYGYDKVTTILFDEPDAHLHVNLQRKIVNYFAQYSKKQFLVATHSEEFIKGVTVDSILSMMSGKPKRVKTTGVILKALSEVDNIDIIRTQDNPFILYVEGEDDGRILSAWAATLGKEELYHQYYPYSLGGGSKNRMKTRMEEHFQALREINPQVKRAILFDFDNASVFHPEETNPVFNEWKRRNIDNYLLVPAAWVRAIVRDLGQKEDNLFSSKYTALVNDFFAGQNLTLPKNALWKTVQANIFQVIDGKAILFENNDSLFNQIKEKSNGQLIINRTKVASAMIQEELHIDIEKFFENLEKI